MYALLDANNFYVSCERVFNPKLNGKPVVVLSNNDGCCISRSDEAKAIGVKMGHPWFKAQRDFPDSGLIAYSANFRLYGELSSRVMRVAEPLGHRQEIYSIDECFIDLSGIRGDLTRRGRVVRERILRWIGIPCCIGIGQTKTLAKLANHIAKSAARKPGSYPVELSTVCNLASLPTPDVAALMAATPVGEIWGIGRRISSQLEAEGINTVRDFVRLDAATVRRRWSVVLERTLRELQGQPCIELEDCPSPRKEIACTRSFGLPVSDLEGLRQAVTEFTARAAEKLRLQGSRAGQVHVFIHTSPFRVKDPQYAKGITVPLLRPTSSTPHLVNAAVAGLQAIYRKGYRFAKAGVMLLDLCDKSHVQGELDLGQDDSVSERLMEAMDALNLRFGKGTVRLASAGVQTASRRWEMKQEMRSPDYLTSWTDIPVVHA